MLHHASDESSTSSCVDTLLSMAIVVCASDIHLESLQHGLRVRYRIDGMLHDQAPIAASIAPQVISRLKVLAHLDITEKRLPQDGKFQLKSGKRLVDIRVATFPGLFGEKMVIRLLDQARGAICLDQLGFSPAMAQQYKDLLSCSQGFFLIAGPTGSGKTTTLYAALSYVNGPHKNIITLEDPVEYTIENITQGQINTDVGFTFEKGMRAMLRQDPDVIMIGEIRDKQSARIAIEASLTGHVVLSSIHTANGARVIMRLLDMEIEPFLLNTSLTCIIAQRLARVLCASCRFTYEPSIDEHRLLQRLGARLDYLWAAHGCSHCSEIGYKGRTGIFELIPVTESLRSLMSAHPSYDHIIAYLRSAGIKFMQEDALEKMKQGITSLNELIRVLA